MTPLWPAILPCIFQGLAMVVDEFYFHHKRDLKKWERIGHPIDSLFLLLPLGWACTQDPSPEHRLIFLGLSVASTLIITKDEWIHRQECEGSELWLHSLLFALHPCVLAGADLLWTTESTQTLALIKGQTGGVCAFMVYQIVYWNWVRGPYLRPLPTEGFTGTPSLQSGHSEASHAVSDRLRRETS